MTAPADHAALHDDIARLRDRERDAFNRYWRAMQEGRLDEADAAFAERARLSTERSALIRAGVLVTLGPLKEDTDASAK